MAEWVYIGTDEMQAAQDRLGLSNERLAARLFIVSKTWERWKGKGAVPRGQLPLVAEILNLEVEASEPIRVFTAEAEAEDDETLAARVDRRLRRIEEALGISQSGEDGHPSGEAANGV